MEAETFRCPAAQAAGYQEHEVPVRRLEEREPPPAGAGRLRAPRKPRVFSPGTLTLLLGLALAVPALSTEVVLSPPGTDGWRPLTFPKIKRHATYTVVTTDGFEALKAQGDCSASAMYLPTGQIELRETPRLHWRWQIEHGLTTANERVKAGDDFAARVYVMFKFDSDHASLWQRARHSLGTALYGDIVPGTAINYVWSSREPAGTRWDNPFSVESKMVSLGTGPLPEWKEQVVDIRADYVALFGYEPPPLLAVAVMTDADNSCQQATAYYADFRFLGR